LAAGGDIFVQGGASLTIEGTAATAIADGVLAHGTGAGAASAGQAFGSGIYLQGTASVLTLNSNGATETVAAPITDDAGAATAAGYTAPSGYTEGSIGLAKTGAGTVVLTGANAYTGGSTITTGTLQIGAGGTVGSITGNVADSGVLAFDRSDSLTFGGTVTGAGSLVQLGTGTVILVDANSYIGGSTIEAGTLQIVSAANIGSGVVTFSAPKSTLAITTTPANGSTFANQLGGFAADGRIDLTGLAFTNGATATIVNSNTVVLHDGGTSLNFILNAAPAGPTQFHVFSDGVNNGTVLSSLLCFLAGTRITTPCGEVPVEQLAVGDLVTTLSGQSRRVVWLGTGRVLATRGRRNAATPVIVKRHALGDNVPHTDLRVTKGHALYLDGVLIPVEFLVNHRSILWDDHAQEVTIYHIELETHDVLLANGAPAESYRDDGNRWLFQNANSGWELPRQEPCAPVLTGGPRVDAIWRRLLDRAGPRPGVPLTDDADVHLLVDGERVDRCAKDGAMYTFRLAGSPSTVRIASRASAQDELGLMRDPRLLGIALRQIELWHGRHVKVMEADEALLRDGFHAYEQGNGFRWTNGDAALPASLFAGIEGACEVVLHVGCTASYASAEGGARAVA
jgi:autotransporter-associated beta strand protein